MSDEVPADWELREIFTFGPGQTEFRKADYPWLVGVGVFAKGGDAAVSDGGAGIVILALYASKTAAET